MVTRHSANFAVLVFFWKKWILTEFKVSTNAICWMRISVASAVFARCSGVSPVCFSTGKDNKKEPNCKLLKTNSKIIEIWNEGSFFRNFYHIVSDGNIGWSAQKNFDDFRATLTITIDASQVQRGSFILWRGENDEAGGGGKNFVHLAHFIDIGSSSHQWWNSLRRLIDNGVQESLRHLWFQKERWNAVSISLPTK